MKKYACLLEIFLIFLLFALFGAYPVPDTNEAHYLGKAANYWNSAYAGNDFFLQSPDAHAVFYWTFGWLTKFFTMEAVAWIGRILTWLLLAVGWRHMTGALFPKMGQSLLAAALFLFLNSQMSFAGEWVVGGVEAKGFAFVFLFFALGQLARNHWNRCWILLGFATMFHVLVGGWSILGVGLTWILMKTWSKEETHLPSLVSMLPALILAFLLTLPALIPALTLNSGVDAKVVTLANKLYVVDRLPHHLLLSFIAQKTPIMLLNLGIMFMLWNLLCARPRLSNGEMHLRMFVYASLCFVLCGWIINLCMNLAPDTVVALLRYYWFRLADVVLPMGIALMAVEFCAFPVPLDPIPETLKNKKERKALEEKQVRTLRRLKIVRKSLAIVLLLVAGYVVASSAYRVANVRVPRSCAGAKNLESWTQMCDWVRENTSQEDIFVVPYTTRTFTWYARRPVVGVWKDIPQDAKNLCEWWDRMHIQFYGFDPADPTYSYGRLRSFSLLPEQRLNQIRDRYHATYIVSTSDDLPGREPVYKNKHFAVWKL